jgi:hypothetical protein
MITSGFTKKGRNSLKILGALTIWNHCNHCVFDVANPNLVEALILASEKGCEWMIVGARGSLTCCPPLQENNIHSSVFLYSSVLRNITVLYSSVSQPTKLSKTDELTWQGLRGAPRYIRRLIGINLYAMGTPPSKSFLSFLDSCINSRIDKLGVSFGTDVKQEVRNIKRLEASMLEQDIDQTHREASCLIESENDISDDDSDFDINQQTIQHLIGDIANDILGDVRSPLNDFKPGSKKNKAGSRKKKKNKKSVAQNRH